MLDPGKKRRYIAGSYNATTHKPRYEIEINVANHVKDQIEVKKILVGTPENCQWGWDIHNKSTWPAFVTVKKDGIRIV